MASLFQRMKIYWLLKADEEKTLDDIREEISSYEFIGGAYFDHHQFSFYYNTKTQKTALVYRCLNYLI